MFSSQWSSIPIRRNVVYNPVLNEGLKTYYGERNNEYFCTVNVSYPDTELRRVGSTRRFELGTWTLLFIVVILMI